MADETKGKAEHLGGKLKEKAGEMTGDREMEAEGRLDQQKARAEQDEARAERRAESARTEKMEAEVRKKGIEKDRTR